MTEGSSWTQLEYASRQILPERDGTRDELDPVTWWDVTAVQCSDEAPDRVVGRGVVAVFDLTRPGPLRIAVDAYGGDIAHAAGVLLDDSGRLRPDVGSPDVDRVVLFLGVDVDPEGADRGLPLRSADAVRARLADRHALIASFPTPYTDDPDEPLFLKDVPEAVRAGWRARGLRHVGHGIWILPVTAPAVEPA